MLLVCEKKRKGKERERERESKENADKGEKRAYPAEKERGKTYL